MNIDHLDHVVFTIQDIQATCDFYQKVLGVDIVHFGPGRTALQFGRQKLNLHEAGKEFEPKALHPTPGSADLCFLTFLPLEQVIAWKLWRSSFLAPLKRHEPFPWTSRNSSSSDLMRWKKSP